VKNSGRLTGLAGSLVEYVNFYSRRIRCNLVASYVGVVKNYITIITRIA